MPAKLTLVEFAEMLADHKTKDLIEMLYLRMSEDDLMEMADEHDAKKCVECEEVVEDEEGWSDGKLRLFCDDCKVYNLEYRDEYHMCVECGCCVDDDDDEGWRDSNDKLYCYECKQEADNCEVCSGDEDDYDFVECCDTGCKYKGHYVKKTEADKTDGRTDGEDQEERKWASHFVKKEALSS